MTGALLVSGTTSDAGKSVVVAGLDQLRALAGRPTLGVLPWRSGLQVDAEDSLALDAPVPLMRPPVGRDVLDVAVVRLPRLSKFTDVDALGCEPGVRAAFVDRPADVERADLAVLRGTKATVTDLAWLRARGLDVALADRARRGAPILAVCGGYQMLGGCIDDPIESGAGRVDGLGLLPVATTFAPEKVLACRRGTSGVFDAADEVVDAAPDAVLVRLLGGRRAWAGFDRLAWRCAEAGHARTHRIVVMPYFLFTGVLADRIADQARAFADAHADTTVDVARWLGPDDRIASLVLDRYDEALAGPVARHCDTCVHRVALPGFTDKVGVPLRPHHHADDAATHRHSHPHSAGASP